MSTKVRNPYFDILKGIACICVVFIHCQFPSHFGMIVTALAKFAVPIFFMISGYYAINKGKFHLKRKVLRIIKMTLYAEIVIFLYELLKSFFMEGWRNYLSETFNFYNLMQSIVLNKPITYSHLWFLYALIYCYFTLYFIDKYKLYRVAFVLMIVGQIGFFFLGEGLTILGYSYYFELSFLYKTYEWVPFNMYIFRALPYFLFGYLCAQYNMRLLDSKTAVYILLVVGAILSIFERYVIGWFQFYLGTIFLAIALFTIATKYNGNNVIKNKYLKFLELVGKKKSDFVYVIHVLIASMLSTFLKLTGLDNYNNILMSFFRYTRPILILFISLILAEIRNRMIVCVRGKNE